MSDNGDRAVWGSKLGFLLAAIGSAVGLGNIWRFSYMAYENGGGAFLVPYFFALLVAGIPLIILEFGVGHRFKGSPALAFSKQNRLGEILGWWMPTVATIGIQLFYSVVIAWCVQFMFFSFSQPWSADSSAFFYGEFLQLSSSPLEFVEVNYSILATSFVVWLATWFICFKEVNHGIEKACSVFMPLLFILTAVLVFWSLSLDGAMDGIKAYLVPDWSKINIFESKEAWGPWSAAFGQIFFTLSLGFGIMITYASYLPKDADIVGYGLKTSLANCAYSLFAGLAVFGTLGFMAAQKGIPIAEVAKGGPGLAFVVYPEAISSLPMGSSIFGVAFFLTLVIAGMSSGVSLIEAFVCSLTDKFNWKRKRVVTVVCIIGFAASAIFCTNAGLYILDIVDHFISNYALVLGGLLECLFVGWVIKAHVLRSHINSQTGVVLIKLWDWSIKVITPVILGIILFQTIDADLTKNYEGYTTQALWIFGGGMLGTTIILAIFFSLFNWKTPKPEHKPEDEHLLM